MFSQYVTFIELISSTYQNSDNIDTTHIVTYVTTRLYVHDKQLLWPLYLGFTLTFCHKIDIHVLRKSNILTINSLAINWNFTVLTSHTGAVLGMLLYFYRNPSPNYVFTLTLIVIYYIYECGLRGANADLGGRGGLIDILLHPFL